MRRIAHARSVVLAFGIWGLIANAADASEAWPITPLNPANGGVYGITPPTADGRVGAVATEIQSPVQLPSGTQTVMEITAENVQGQDGTLADDKQVSIGILYVRDSDPSRWYGQVSAGAFQRPGTYYFQYSALVHDRYDDGKVYCSSIPPGSDGLCTYASPVFTFAIRAPTPSATSPAVDDEPQYRLGYYTALTKVKSYVKRRFKGRRIRATCSRNDPSQFACRVRYVRKGRTRRVRIKVYRDAIGLHYSVKR